MRRAIALVLVCLACASQGRRVRAASEGEDSDYYEGVKSSQLRPQRRAGVPSPSSMFSSFLLALDPETAWQTSMPKAGGHLCFSRGASSSSVLMRQGGGSAASFGDKDQVLTPTSGLLRATSQIQIPGIPDISMQRADTFEYDYDYDDRIGPPPDLPSMLFDNRIVYLGMPIASSVAELIVSELLYLQSEKPDDAVTMYINSPGTTTEKGQLVGFESEAFAIYDTMNYVSTPIETICVGKAYGLSAMLLANGKKGKRGCMPYGTVMLHQPRGQMAQGQASDIALKAKEVLYNRKLALDIMSKLTGQTIDKLTEDTNRCLYMGPEAAIEYGVIDRVLSKPVKGAKDLSSALS